MTFFCPPLIIVSLWHLANGFSTFVSRFVIYMYDHNSSKFANNISTHYKVAKNNSHAFVTKHLALIWCAIVILEIENASIYALTILSMSFSTNSFFPRNIFLSVLQFFVTIFEEVFIFCTQVSKIWLLLNDMGKFGSDHVLEIACEECEIKRFRHHETGGFIAQTAWSRNG